MSFPRYPAYKDSGVEWLGSVPEHWTAIRLKNVLAQRITDGPHLTPVFVPDGVPFLSVDGIQNGELTFDSCRYVSEDDHIEFSKKVRPQRDDVLMGKAASTGKIARVKVDFEFSIWSPLALIRVDHRVALPSFVEYTLKSPQTQAEIDVLCTSNTQKNISMDDIPKLALACPPIEEQAIITEFLDRETAKIDALVAEQEQLITLLKEKRQAVISHAVTKGLDPSVPMKDSGVEWLGEVPEHWKVKPLRYCVDYQEGPGILADDFRDEGVPLLRVAGVQDEWASLEGCNYLDPEKVAKRWNHFRLSKGDLLVSASASMGTICEVGEEAQGAIPYTGIIRMRGRTGEMTKRFLRHMVVSRPFLTQIDLLKAGATIQHYGPTHLSQMFAVCPPVKEQDEIADFVDTELTRLSRLSDEAGLVVQLLQERRSALISAAVTGKIDVRGLVAHPEEGLA
jgi:type I restriction enzyme S subunit